MNIDDKYKWLARDKDGELYAYEGKPEKEDDDSWAVDYKDWYLVKETDDTYSFIRWEQDEPMSVLDARAIIAGNSIAKAVSDFGRTAEELIEESGQQYNPINKPNHYIGIHGLEVEEVLQNFIPRYENSYAGHRVASAIEYLLRAPLKNKLEDIEKAKQNLEQILNYEKEQPHE